MSETTLFLFRNDLRLNDNAGLIAASQSGQPLILLFIYDETHEDWSLGSASRWWLHHSLLALSKDIKKLGGCLFLRKGNTIDILGDLIEQANVSKLYFSRTYEPNLRKIEDTIYSKWNNVIEIKRYGGYLLFEPEQIRTGKDEPYKAFTPFWKSCLNQPEPGISKKALKNVSFCRKKLSSECLEDWKLLPIKPDWAWGLRNSWQPGESGAFSALKEFLDNGIVLDYHDDRDRPDKKGTSRLSPHLHFGEISPARIWHETKQRFKKYKRLEKGGLSFLRELGWRDFSTQLLFNWPDLPNAPFRKEYKSFPWKNDKHALQAWQKGQTGYPIVDAGMRELWHTGWMHNRVRMIVASFLVKHLLIHWRNGKDWFWDTLVDADLANNSASWQWVAGCGADAAPYFRIFNPILQGKKFDPHGDYIRHWVPEIRSIPTKLIHEPWELSESELAGLDIKLGRDYPNPVIVHESGRKGALQAYKTMQEKQVHT